MELITKNPKRTFSILLISSLGMMAVALFMEHFLQLKPCILCYMQRGAVILIGVIAALGLMINSKNINLYKVMISSVLVCVFSGIALSIRQLYLQSLPADLVPSCAPDIDYLFSTLPFLEVLILAFSGDGNCAEVLWSFMGISIPGWLLIGFFFIAVYCFLILKNVNEIHSHI
ncbi:disulfide bond formation protein B [Gammaproteobacteria bacterium]|nr:disulfide bond formation protein B [Gammaproteobacteria bacterium]